MSITIYTSEDADVRVIADKTTAVIGYGNQGRAHALNLRDSGCRVVVGQKPGGQGWQNAKDDDFKPLPASQAAEAGDLVILTLPDESAADIYRQEIHDHLQPGNVLGFVHGFNITYNMIVPPPEVDVIMVAPKGPGSLLRSKFIQGSGIPCQIAVEHDATTHAKQIALAWAAGIGCTRVGAMETSFKTETEMDLFSEQAVLCGGATALVQAAFDVLVEAGYPPEFAYMDCVHELKQVMDILHEGGINLMHDRVSNTAQYGHMTRGPRIIDEHVRQTLRTVLEEIRRGDFAKEWLKEKSSGLKNFGKLDAALRDALMEKIGAKMRRLAPAKSIKQ